MRIKFVGILMIAASLAACSSKKAVATTPEPVAPVAVGNTVTENTVVEGTEPPARLLTPEEIAQGKSLYENNCAKCHKLFAPTDYTYEKWKPILIRMQKKARMDDAQMVAITNYINSEL